VRFVGLLLVAEEMGEGVLLFRAVGGSLADR
jgi:hypothetical protein